MKSKTETKETHIYHQGLIRILVEHKIKSKGLAWKESLAQHQIEEKRVEEKFEQIHKTRRIMNYLLNMRTRSKKQQDSIMIENEKYFLSITRRPRKKSQEETNSKGKDPEVKIVEPPPTSK